MQLEISALLSPIQRTMQHSGMLNHLRQSVVRQRVAGVCRPQQQQHSAHNSRRGPASCPATGVQDAAVASVSAIPDVLPPSTNGLKKQASSYSSAAAPLPADIKRVLFSAAQVQDKVAELAAQICKDHKGKPLALIGVLNGAFIFTSGEEGWRRRGRQQHPVVRTCLALFCCRQSPHSTPIRVCSVFQAHPAQSHLQAPC